MLDLNSSNSVNLKQNRENANVSRQQKLNGFVEYNLLHFKIYLTREFTQIQSFTSGQRNAFPDYSRGTSGDYN